MISTYVTLVFILSVKQLSMSNDKKTEKINKST